MLKSPFCTFSFYLIDVAALAVSISNLSIHTRLARTAQWAALQMADKGNPKLAENLKACLEEPVDLSLYINPTPLETFESQSSQTNREIILSDMTPAEADKTKDNELNKDTDLTTGVSSSATKDAPTDVSSTTTLDSPRDEPVCKGDVTKDIT